jgi:hypothetical protein
MKVEFFSEEGGLFSWIHGRLENNLLIDLLGVVYPNGVSRCMLSQRAVRAMKVNGYTDGEVSKVAEALAVAHRLFNGERYNYRDKAADIVAFLNKYVRES